MNFTETWLKTLLPKQSAYRTFEKGSIKGFGVKVYPKGSISFFMCHQDNDSVRYKTLGNYPIMSLADARIAAVDFKQQLLKGGTPTVSGTLQELCDNYIAAMITEGKRSHNEVKRVIDKNVLVYLDPNMLASEVTTYDIRKLMFSCIERGAGRTGNLLRSYLMSAFSHGIKHDNDPRKLDTKMTFNLTQNPVALIPRVAEFEKVGERVLSLDEIKEVWNYKGNAISIPHLIAIKLIILLGGLRPGEVSQMPVEEIDLERKVISIPPKRTKNKRWHLIPISPYVEHLVRTQISYTPSANFLFPHRHAGVDKPQDVDSLAHSVSRLVDELKMPYWTCKDLRRTCKTWAGDAGLSKEIRDRLQNHALNDVSSKHYDRYSYMREKKEALQVWEDYILNEVS